jgi:hypothetical protein
MSAIESLKEKYPLPPSDDLLWDGQAVADFLGIPLTRVYYLIRTGQLPIAKLGRKTIVASRRKLQRAIGDTLANKQTVSEMPAARPGA